MFRYDIHDTATQPFVLGLGIHTSPSLAIHAPDPHQIIHATADFLTTDLLTPDIPGWFRSCLL